jgi:hypothetical protein
MPPPIEHSSPGPVRVLDVHSPADLESVLGAVVPTTPRPVLVLVGGASGLAPEVARRLLDCFRVRLCPLLERLGAVVVDGGTDAGVMKVIALARQQAAARFALLGVAARGTLADPAADERAEACPGQARPEPRHDALLRVPGDAWGDEIPWMNRVAGMLARDAPSVTLVAGGGGVTLLDVQASLGQGRAVLALTGSGGVADRLAAAALDARAPADLPFVPLLIHAVAADDGWAALEVCLGKSLGGGVAADGGASVPVAPAGRNVC